jgi:2-keto-3-deoxy-L-rhamnonate aldolase RhmA
MKEGQGMRTNTAKEKMLQGKPAFGYSLGLGSPLAAEILANSGIDFILLDNQYGDGKRRSDPDGPHRPQRLHDDRAFAR